MLALRVRRAGADGRPGGSLCAWQEAGQPRPRHQPPPPHTRSPYSRPAPPPLQPLALQLADADNLSAVSDALAQPTLIAVAAHFPSRDQGTVRLIDNAVVGQVV
jgi:hypothetical protein